MEDMEDELEAVVFPSTYPNVAGVLKEGQVVFLKGRASFREEIPKIVVNDVKPIEEIYKAVKSISVDLSSLDEKDLTHLKEKLSSFPGRIPVYLRLDTKAYKSVQILVGEDLFVSPNEILMSELKELVGDGNFSLTI
jgi:DNA polymerase-3 subunit alpha